MRIGLILIVPGLAACANVPERPPDDFVIAAQSWEGFPVAEMINRWGEPDSVKSDSVTWRIAEDANVCRNVRKRRWKNNREVDVVEVQCAQTNAKSHKCTVTANVDESGFIEEISAYSHRCGIVFADSVRLLDAEYPNNAYKFEDPPK